MIYTLNLVEVVLSDRIVLYLAFTHVNGGLVMLFAREHIFEGCHNTCHLQRWVLFRLLHGALEEHILLRILCLIYIHWLLVLVDIVNLRICKHSPIVYY